ncbi:hypothetical protein [Kitasatospora sp. NPDC085879]|uniref:hypothetical protein n=1 Tax=Kitasatospora sp. NPDC085879 TaxID=3154769 RepID=UPI003416A174
MGAPQRDGRGIGSAADGVVALFMWGVVVGLDSWLLGAIWSGYRRATAQGWDLSAVHGQEKSALLTSALLCGAVLLGALCGGFAGRNETAARRWRNAAVGALAAHLLLLGLLVVAILVHPPRLVF